MARAGRLRVRAEPQGEDGGIEAGREIEMGAYRETIADGIESAPGAFLGMLKGKNFGKQLVKLV